MVTSYEDSRRMRSFMVLKEEVYFKFMVES